MLSLKCYFLKLKIEHALRKSADFERLWLEAWTQWTKTTDRLREANKDRNLWRDRWKQGAFEMDAASMAALVDQEEA
jgi:hypothetical protein